jgi:SPP1 gp7 family putative phage head morphogenesis protein
VKRTAIPRRLPRPASVDPAEREYFKMIRQYVAAYVKAMHSGLEQILPGLKETAGEELPRYDNFPPNLTRVGTAPDHQRRMDEHQKRLDANIEKMIARLFESLTESMAGQYPDPILSKWAWSMVNHVNRIGKRNIVKTAKAVDLEVEPLLRDGELTPYFQNVVDENVGLIKSIPMKELATFKNKLVAAITRDAPQSEIREMLQSNFDASSSSARLIARDQTNKLNGAVAKYRQQSLGGKRYKWRGAMDKREREDHRRLEGKTFLWSSPPVTNRSTGAKNHPGGDFQCRCWPEPVLEDMIE